jgi:hypothetical protein
MDYELERMWKEVVIAHFRGVCNHITEKNDIFPNLKFKVCKSVHHHTIQLNHQLDATIYPAVSGFTVEAWW